MSRKCLRRRFWAILAAIVVGAWTCSDPASVLAAEAKEVLRYEVTWNGNKAGHGDISTELDSKDVKVTVHAVSDGALKAILDIWSRVQATFGAGTFKPKWYRFQMKSNILAPELVDLTFDHRTGHVTVNKQKGDEQESHQEKFHKVYDPITAAFLLRNQTFGNGPKSVDIYDGKDKARLHVEPAATGPVSVKGGSYPAVGLDVKLTKLTGDKKEIGKGRLWLSDDKHRVPLLLISSAIVGKVRFELVKVER